MKNLYILVFVCLLSMHLHAQLEGPNSGSSFSNVTITGSNKTWNNCGNSGSSDNVYSSFGNLGGGIGAHTDYLVATGFNFNIPAGVTISGIVVEVERSDPNGRTSDYRIRIVKGGNIGAADRSGGAGYGISDSYQLYGNAGDLWGETWSVEEINSPTFGVAIAAQRSAASGVTAGRIDDIRITVFYDFTTLPVTLTSFIATLVNKEVIVRWNTSDESSMSHYLVQRSVNGRDFTAIGTVNSRNSVDATSYSFNDNAPVSGTSYYRLKMIGTAGDVKHSPVAAINFAEKQSVDLYPTVISAGQPIFIRNDNSEKLTVQFYTANGQQTANVTTTTRQIAPGMIPARSGIQYYHIYRENRERVGSGRVILQ